MWSKRLSLIASLLVVAAVVFRSDSALAHRPAAPPAASLSQSVFAPSQNCAVPCLWEQVEPGTGKGAVSAEYEPAFDFDNSEAADDFQLDCPEPCLITRVTVVGRYSGGVPSVASGANVRFYNNVGTLPGGEISAQTVQSSTMTIYTGPNNTVAFVIPLGLPVLLATGTYWVSVQAIKHDVGMTFRTWLWDELQDQPGVNPKLNPSAWRNPNLPSGTLCNGGTWGRRLDDCQQPSDGSGRDLLFRLEGFVPATILYLPVISR